MDEWEYAFHLINAKKNIDSMIYISKNFEELGNVNLRMKSDDIRKKFYIELVIILDKSFIEKSFKKRIICKENTIIDSIYYERDKNGVHRDDDYVEKNYDSLFAIIDEMKEQLEEVKNFCTEQLPSPLTLDYVSHDRELFRIVNRVNAKEEEKIKKKKYPGYGEKNDTTVKDGRTFKILQRFEDIKYIKEKEKNEFVVIIVDGINYEEGIQDRQDSWIKINQLFGYNCWPSPKRRSMEFVDDMKSIGLYSKFGSMLQDEKTKNAINTDPILQNRLVNKVEKYKNYLWC